MVTTKEEICKYYYKEEYLLLDVICSLLGVFMLIFSLLVLIYAPGKTIAKYGTVVDIHHYGIAQKINGSHAHVLLDDGELVTIRKTNWFNLSKNKKVVLQETSYLVGGVKRHSFYNKD